MATNEVTNRALDLIKSNLCPICRKSLIAGPKGGASQNFYCEPCGQGFNVHGVQYGRFAVDFLGPVAADLIAKYKSGELP